MDPGFRRGDDVSCRHRSDRQVARPGWQHEAGAGHQARFQAAGDSWIATRIAAAPPTVTPAKAGVHPSSDATVAAWTPAFAGVTIEGNAAPVAIPLTRSGGGSGPAA